MDIAVTRYGYLKQRRERRHSASFGQLDREKSFRPFRVHAIHHCGRDDAVRARGSPNESAGTGGPARQKAVRVFPSECRIHFNASCSEVDEGPARAEVTKRPPYAERSRRGIGSLANEQQVPRQHGQGTQERPVRRDNRGIDAPDRRKQNESVVRSGVIRYDEQWPRRRRSAVASPLNSKIAKSGCCGMRDSALRDARVKACQDSAQGHRRKPEACADGGAKKSRSLFQSERVHHLVRGMSGKCRLDTF